MLSDVVADLKGCSRRPCRRELAELEIAVEASG